MFSFQEIEHFRTFGFVVLRGLLRGEEIAALRGEVTGALREAFGGIGRAADQGGIPGDYLPLAVDRAPVSQRLIADDARLFQGSTDLCGTPTVPTPGIAVCFTGNAGWHTEVGPDVKGVKFLVHLEPRTAETGALRLLPGSHHSTYARSLSAYRSRDPGSQGFAGWPAPGTVLETEPGDVIAFDLHLYHSSRGGADRLAWMIEYLPWPGLGDPDGMRVVRDLVVDGADYDGYDRERWPAWREWAASTRDRPSRRVAVDRLTLLGVLDPPARDR